MRDKSLNLACVSLLFAPLASSAYACSQCQNATAWRLFPPLLIWGWIGAGWFLGISCAAAYWKVKVRFIPRLRATIPLLVLALFAFRLGLGFFSVLLFLPFAFLGGISVLLNRSTECPRRFRSTLHIISGLAVLAIAVTSATEIMFPTPRSPVDIILKWEGTGPERGAFVSLKKREPESVNDYRTIVMNANLFVVLRAAERLAEISDPRLDVPIIIDALARVREDSDEYLARNIEDVLREITHFTLEEGTSADQWRKAWEDSQLAPLVEFEKCLPE